MAEEKKVPTPDMLKAREELANMTPEEREAERKAMREKLRRYYDGRFSPEMMKALRGLKPKE